jgi:hypothetical protein
MSSTLGRLGAPFAVAVLATLASPSCTSTANVTDVWMSLDQDGARHRNVFFTDTKSIFCVAEVAIGRNNATLEMLLRRVQTYDFAKGDVVDVNVVNAHNEQRPAVSADRQLVTLKVPRTTTNAQGQSSEGDDVPFVPGRLQCEVSIDGQLFKSTTFNIEFPPCPTDAITPATLCVGFYPVGQTCPKSGASGAPQPTCKCGEKGWEC